MISFEREIREQLMEILTFWRTYTPDCENGGFFGSVREDNSPDRNAAKGSVLNARILWTFSAAYSFLGNEQDLVIAHRAFDYILQHMTDSEYGGIYWSVDSHGQKLDDRKHIYAQAFGIYGMSEYYRATKNEAALIASIDLFHLVEKYSYDIVYGGYMDAFQRNWDPLTDKRLSSKDANAPKTMNTHLHILEAYANLFELWPDEILEKRITGLLKIFSDRIIDSRSDHLQLFFDAAWQSHPSVISYGHDIEAAWLLLESAEKIKNVYWISRMKNISLSLTRAAMKGLDSDGGLFYEHDILNNVTIREKHWWPQAEAMIAFFDAGLLTKDPQYPEAMLRTWDFIKTYIISAKGEWHWGILDNHMPMPDHDKAGFWKCPYHNSRSCMEILKRIQSAGL
jgi:mannobiose 2-epimerase